MRHFNSIQVVTLAATIFLAGQVAADMEGFLSGVAGGVVGGFIQDKLTEDQKNEKKGAAASTTIIQRVEIKEAPSRSKKKT